ncbi:hypothetical protein BN874_1860022 [Candidatus Contendobacter odensis Run_B_J11]|uniref:Uncharacterized protein n=1 Tax=Candidatus Contendobacter odensis Run_B_J11 TaxID=1400861 RepID=A0A7U7J273_9GAMM|nr:hypothetical protein BN874_1860022 [Candidatus Contendobacter odensis Run_B_J11]
MRIGCSRISGLVGEPNRSPGLHGIRVPGAYRCNGLVEPTELSAFPGTGPTYGAMIVEGLTRKPG